MEEAVSPGQRATMINRLQSPTTALFLGSNDDKLERAQARAAARAAAIHRTAPASFTLEAGVKIYSVRVDAVHAEAYKVLSGINRVGQEDVHGIFAFAQFLTWWFGDTDALKRVVA
ncbi:hypothetical protein SLEP1_g53041 [Rubroshorea leprosula]|uniref:Condensin complex subunit 2 n=1 Tax=Rubroshorea leprosula TaxID=152421 RepID=A0AAV5M8A6_9ROSI|nr:hypothetical protein SLEP1_g53041 [Rubroshorea leprosula]